MYDVPCIREKDGVSLARERSSSERLFLVTDFDVASVTRNLKAPAVAILLDGKVIRAPAGLSEHSCYQ